MIPIFFFSTATVEQCDSLKLCLQREKCLCFSVVLYCGLPMPAK